MSCVSTQVNEDHVRNLLTLPILASACSFIFMTLIKASMTSPKQLETLVIFADVAFLRFAACCVFSSFTAANHSIHLRFCAILFSSSRQSPKNMTSSLFLRPRRGCSRSVLRMVHGLKSRDWDFPGILSRNLFSHRGLIWVH